MPIRKMCGELVTGSTAGYVQNFKINVGAGNFVGLQYNTFDIPDQIEVINPATGIVLFRSIAGTTYSCLPDDDSLEASSSTVSIPIRSLVNSAEVVVKVTTPCGGSEWQFTLSCATPF